MHYRIFSSTLGLHPLAARSNKPPYPYRESKRCQALPNVPWSGQNHPWLITTALSESEPPTYGDELAPARMEVEFSEELRSPQLHNSNAAISTAL